MLHNLADNEVIKMNRMIRTRIFGMFFAFFTVIAALGVNAHQLHVQCGVCQSSHCFQLNADGNAVECQSCQQCYSPAQVLRDFNQARTRHRGASVSHGDLLVTLSTTPYSGQAFNQQPTMSSFGQALSSHQLLLSASHLTATTIITPQLVQAILAGTPQGSMSETTFEKLKRTIVLAILMVLYTNPELAADQNGLRLEVMALVTALYYQMQHSNDDSTSPLMTHGFQVAEQSYISLYHQLEQEIVDPFSLIPSEVQSFQGAVEELFEILDYQENGYHFFSHPNFGIGALIHNNNQWTLVFHSGLIVSAEKKQLVYMLAMAHTGLLVMLSGAVGHALTYGTFILAGTIVGVVAARIFSGSWEQTFIGAGLGAAGGGAAALVGSMQEDPRSGYGRTARRGDDSGKKDKDKKKKPDDKDEL